jgi:hypothetical protein
MSSRHTRSGGVVARRRPGDVDSPRVACHHGALSTAYAPREAPDETQTTDDGRPDRGPS